MAISAKQLALNVEAWASRAGIHEPIFVCEIVGFDQLHDLIPQLNGLSDRNEAMRVAQARGIASSQFSRRISDALDEGRLEEARRLTLSQNWPGVSVFEKAIHLERLFAHVLKFGRIEIQVDRLHPQSIVVCISVIAQSWNAHTVAQTYDKFRHMSRFEI